VIGSPWLPDPVCLHTTTTTTTTTSITSITSIRITSEALALSCKQFP